ncbi:MAG: hypothetical protein KDA28_07175, partial [Phycisphaerales bacterium]|nr:hypothetical protein [Phycisphaerales bacterium]
ADDLVDAGLIADRWLLRDARQPVVISDPVKSRSNQDKAALFRIVDAWRDGPIATTDLPREGTWVILTGAGQVYTQSVDPDWVGRYEARALTERERDERLRLRAAHFGAYVSDGTTDSGRRGVGVDALVPGYYRHGFGIEFSTRYGETDLRPGDLIVTCDGVRVESVRDLEDLLPDGQFMLSSLPLLEVIRDGRIVFVRPLLDHDFDGIAAPEPRTRRDQAVAMLERDDVDEASEVDHILLGILDLETLDERPGARERLGPERWTRAWEHAEGSEAAIAMLDDWLAEDGVHQWRRQELELLRSAQLRRLGRFEEAARLIDVLEARHRYEIQVEIAQNGADDEDVARSFDNIQDVRLAKFGTLLDLGRPAEALAYAREFRTLPHSDKALQRLAGDCLNIFFFEGYPRAGLTLAREWQDLFAAQDGFEQALAFLDEYVRELESEIAD